MKGDQMLQKLGAKSRLFLKRNSSTILTVVGAVGVVATAVTAVKATPKAVILLESAKQEKGDKLTKLEMVKVVGPVYIPSIVIGAATISCIFGANILNKRQQASMMSAYALLDRSYKDYRNKVKDLYGKEVDQHIINESVKDKLKEADISVGEDKQLFYDYFSERYFESTIEEVQRAEYRVNRDLVMRDYIFLNEFYEQLGLEPTDEGYELGWSVGGNLARYWKQWIDFDHEKVEMDDGLECIIITMQEEPYLDFGDYA